MKLGAPKKKNNSTLDKFVNGISQNIKDYKKYRVWVP